MYKIVIVDDEIEIVKVIKRYLSRIKKYEIVTYNNPLDLLSNVDDDIDLFLIDVMMPQLNGLELMKKLKILNNSYKFLIMTAYSSLDKGKEIIYEDDNIHIAKPFESMEYLEYKISKLLI